MCFPRVSRIIMTSKTYLNKKKVVLTSCCLLCFVSWSIGKERYGVLGIIQWVKTKTGYEEELEGNSEKKNPTTAMRSQQPSVAVQGNRIPDKLL